MCWMVNGGQPVWGLQVHPEGKFVVDLDKSIEMKEVQANCRVALKNDSYKLHKILPNKVSSYSNWQRVMSEVVARWILWSV